MPRIPALYFWLTFLVILSDLVPQCVAQWNQRQHHQQNHQQYHHQQQQQRKPPVNTMEYYTTLSVSKQASEVEIKKAYKKLAIKYHPDKNLDDQEGAKAKFQEVSNAYEVLSDSERRKIYDQEGVEGVQQHDQRQGRQEQNSGDPFAHFFHGGFHHQQREHVPDLFGNTDVQELDLQKIGMFYKRQEIWILYFYNPKLPECQQAKQEYITLAQKMYGIIKVASLDCFTEEELCESFSAYEVPQTLVFTEAANEDGERYRGQFAWNPLANFAAKKMQSFVSYVSEENFEAFGQRDRLTKHKIIIFQDKKGTPSIYKAMSKKFLDRLVFGQVKSDEAALVKKFQITVYPTIVVLTDPDSNLFTKYEGEMKVDQLSKWMSSFAYQTPSKVKKLEFQPLSQKSVKSGICGPKDSNICMILFADAEAEAIAYSELVARFASDPVSFGYIGTWKEYPGNLQKHTMFEGAKTVLYKAKRMKWLKLEDDRSLELQISDVLGGSGQWKSTGGQLFAHQQLDEL